MVQNTHIIKKQICACIGMVHYPVLAAIIQSVSEFLPISSSAHLTIFSWLIHSTIPMTDKIMLHLGGLLALMIYYRHFIISSFLDLFSTNFLQTWALKLILISLPGVVAGLLLNQYMTTLHMPLVIGIASIVGGVLLIAADLHGRRNDLHMAENDVTLSNSQAIIIGFFQVFALIPGMSRMGMVITSARYLGLKREDATHLAFISAMPMIAGAILLNFNDLPKTLPMLTLTGGITLISYGMIYLMLFLVPKVGYVWFGVYRILLGGTLLCSCG
jgi:undecaprenyl-diphosphatase